VNHKSFFCKLKATALFGWEFDPGFAFSPGVTWVNVSLYPTNVPAKWHMNLLNGLSRVHECDRQTDHAMEKCTGRGGFACTAKLFCLIICQVFLNSRFVLQYLLSTPSSH